MQHRNEARPRLAAKPRYAKGVFIVARERKRDAQQNALAVLIALSFPGIPAFLGILQKALA